MAVSVLDRIVSLLPEVGFCCQCWYSSFLNCNWRKPSRTHPSRLGCAVPFCCLSRGCVPLGWIKWTIFIQHFGVKWAVSSPANACTVFCSPKRCTCSWMWTSWAFLCPFDIHKRKWVRIMLLDMHSQLSVPQGMRDTKYMHRYVFRDGAIFVPSQMELLSAVQPGWRSRASWKSRQPDAGGEHLQGKQESCCVY